MESSANKMLECIICMENPAVDPVVTQCGHIFCWPCIKQWVESSNKMFCPTCKNGINLAKVVSLHGNSSGKFNDKPRAEREAPEVNANRPGFFSSLYQSFVYSTQNSESNNRPINENDVKTNQLALVFLLIGMLLVVMIFYIA